MKPVILFRKSLAEEGEFECAKKYFDVIEYRSDIKPNQCVLGRYSVLPYYWELEQDIKKLGGQLVNSHLQHQMVSDIQNWYPYLKDYTPKTWFKLEDVEDCPNGYFLKGFVNSRKQLFRTHSFAANRKEMMEVYFRLMEDSLIQHQGVCIREFIDLKTYGVNDITGCPIGKEFRILMYKDIEIARGFYWSNYEESSNHPKPEQVDARFLKEVIKKIEFKANFWCLDVAQKADGEWIVIELGDAQMCGLSTISPNEFYMNLGHICLGV